MKPLAAQHSAMSDTAGTPDRPETAIAAPEIVSSAAAYRRCRPVRSAWRGTIHVTITAAIHGNAVTSPTRKPTFVPSSADTCCGR